MERNEKSTNPKRGSQRARQARLQHLLAGVRKAVEKKGNPVLSVVDIRRRSQSTDTESVSSWTMSGDESTGPNAPGGPNNSESKSSEGKAVTDPTTQNRSHMRALAVTLTRDRNVQQQLEELFSEMDVDMEGVVKHFQKMHEQLQAKEKQSDGEQTESKSSGSTASYPGFPPGTHICEQCLEWLGRADSARLVGLQGQLPSQQQPLLSFFQESKNTSELEEEGSMDEGEQDPGSSLHKLVQREDGKVEENMCVLEVSDDDWWVLTEDDRTENDNMLHNDDGKQFGGTLPPESISESPSSSSSSSNVRGCVLCLPSMRYGASGQPLHLPDGSLSETAKVLAGDDFDAIEEAEKEDPYDEWCVSNASVTALKVSAAWLALIRIYSWARFFYSMYGWSAWAKMIFEHPKVREIVWMLVSNLGFLFFA